ncbi:hypothetical protein K503DRAFT_688625, partial [Rhizopogon vinicolor AM-OR11-026]
TKAPIPIWLAYIMLFPCTTIPAPFGTRVRHALKAEPQSVKLSNLVGAGGLWYGFRKMIMDILSEEQANGISEVLTKVHSLHTLCAFSLQDTQRFAALGPAGGGPSADSAQSFREGLDGTVREYHLLTESAKRMKRWHEGNDKARHEEYTCHACALHCIALYIST